MCSPSAKATGDKSPRLQMAGAGNDKKDLGTQVMKSWATCRAGA
jgi:hypothetical protein